jgi:hypothetical protein
MDAGMQVIVLMDVFEMSNGTAWMVNRVIPNFKAYRGLILNTVYGEMNTRAVKTAIIMVMEQNTSVSGHLVHIITPPVKVES